MAETARRGTVEQRQPAGVLGGGAARGWAAAAEVWFGLVQAALAFLGPRAMATSGRPLPLTGRILLWAWAVAALGLALVLPRATRRVWIAAAVLAALVLGDALFAVLRALPTYEGRDVPPSVFWIPAARLGPQLLVLALALSVLRRKGAADRPARPKR